MKFTLMKKGLSDLAASLIDTGKWAAGPTAVILKQESGWTYGVLANQIWSFADAGGSHSRPEVNQMFLQPFLAYTWKDSTTLTLNSGSTFYWDTQERSIPINLLLSHVYNFGKQPVSLSPPPRPIHSMRSWLMGPKEPTI